MILLFLFFLIIKALLLILFFKHEVGAHHFLAQVVGRDYEEIIADRAWYPSADHYIKHMYYQLNRDNLVYILAAMLPCPWIYQQVAKRCASKWQDF